MLSSAAHIIANVKTMENIDFIIRQLNDDVPDYLFYMIVDCATTFVNR